MIKTVNHLRNRRVLLIGQELAERAWRVSLTAQLAGPAAGGFIERNSAFRLGNVDIVHADTPLLLLDDEQSITQFDVVIVGAASTSWQDSQFTDSVNSLLTRLDYLHSKSQSHLIAGPLPCVIALATDGGSLNYNGLTLPASSQHILRALKHDYFNLSISLDALIEECLIETTSRVLGLPFPNGPQILRSWLSQFLEEDQSQILKVLGHFRYYSANHLLQLSALYLQSQSQAVVGQSKMIPVLDCGTQPAHNLWLTYLGWPNKSAPAILSIISKSPWLRDLPYKPVTKAYDVLVRDLLPALLSLPEGECIHVLAVDDVIGSGGQVRSYLDRFLNRDLRQACQLFGGNAFGEKLWKQVCDSLVGHDEQRRIIIHAFFLVGSQNEAVEGICRDGLRPDPCASEILNEFHARPRRGEVEVQLEGVKGPSSVVRVDLRIADYTRSLFELVNNGEVPQDFCSIVLRRPQYQFITATREKEHPFQFEPFGWKDSGALVATFLNCPGNTIPIVWGDRASSERTWIPLYRRYFNLWNDGNVSGTQLVSKLRKICRGSLGRLVERGAHPQAIGYVLACRTYETKEWIAQKLGMPTTLLDQRLHEVECRLADDISYREFVRQLFMASS